MLVLRAFTRLVEALLMAAIALLGLGIGLVALNQLISLGSVTPPRLLHLPVVRDHVGHFLTQIASPGPVAVLALLGGIAAILVGLLLLRGMFGSRRERLIIVESDADGDLCARPRVVSQMARAKVETAGGVTSVKRPRVKLRRSGERGRLKIRARRGPDPDLATVDDAVHARIDAFADSLHLRPNVRIKLDEPKDAKVTDA